MFLYRINATGEFVPTKPTGKADTFEKVEIPANGNRVAMADYLNGLTVTKAPAKEEDDNPFGIVPTDEPNPPAYTRALVDSMFTPRPPELRDLCYRIGKLRGAALGHVAFEVAACIAAQADAV